jgi:hypothetical protein
VAVAFCPASSVTVSTIGNAPGAAKSCDAVTPLLVTPFPKFQSYATRLRPVAAVDALPLTVTGWPTVATVGDIANEAVSVVGTPPGDGATEVVVVGSVMLSGPTGLLVSHAVKNTTNRTPAIRRPAINRRPLPAISITLPRLEPLVGSAAIG